MDTDKKRKTIRCQKCGLTFSGERVYCPLCKNRIIDEGTEDSSIKEDFDVFPVTQKNNQNRNSDPFLTVSLFCYNLSAFILSLVFSAVNCFICPQGCLTLSL